MLGYDWSGVGKAEQIEGKIGLKFKVRQGWTETKTDTIYCERVTESIYRVYVWNHPGARGEVADQLAAMLGAPVHSVKG